MAVDEPRLLSQADRMAAEAELFYAYLAGLIDGDGYIGIRQRDKPKTDGDRRRGASYTVHVKIGGEPNHLNGLREQLGLGTMYVRKRPGQRHLAEWTIAHQKARTVLQRVTPYLRLKAKQAACVLSMPQARSRWDMTDELRAAQEDSYQKIKQLNTLGRGRSSDGSRG